MTIVGTPAPVLYSAAELQAIRANCQEAVRAAAAACAVANRAAAEAAERVAELRARSAQLREKAQERRGVRFRTVPVQPGPVAPVDDVSGLISDLRAALSISDLPRSRAGVFDAVLRASSSGGDREAVLQRRLPGHRYEVVAATSLRVRALVEAQVDCEEGPSVQASRRRTRAAGDASTLAFADHWPTWSRRVTRAGFGRAVSAPLESDRGELGYLYVFGSPDGWGWQELQRLRLVAQETAVALALLGDKENLWLAIDARHRIGVAQGLVMQRYGVSADQAYSLLRRISQQEGIKLAVVAEQIVAGGGLRDVN
jgi:hypothetical protein